MFNVIFHLALWKLKDGAGLNTAGQHKMLAPQDKDLSLQQRVFQSDWHFLNTTIRCLTKKNLLELTTAQIHQAVIYLEQLH